MWALGKRAIKAVAITRNVSDFEISKVGYVDESFIKCGIVHYNQIFTSVLKVQSYENVIVVRQSSTKDTI